MSYFLYEYNHIRQDEMRQEARLERTLNTLHAETPTLRDRIFLKVGDQLISLGCRLRTTAISHRLSHQRA